MFNLVIKDQRSEVLQPLGIPAWEREGDTFSEGSHPQGYLDLLTWQPRRIRLHVDEGSTTVRDISYGQGRKLELPDGCFDPLTAYRSERPVEFDDERAIWRDSEAIFSKANKDHRRPAVLTAR